MVYMVHILRVDRCILALLFRFGGRPRKLRVVYRPGSRRFLGLRLNTLLRSVIVGHFRVVIVLRDYVSNDQRCFVSFRTSGCVPVRVCISGVFTMEDGRVDHDGRVRVLRRKRFDANFRGDTALCLRIIAQICAGDTRVKGVIVDRRDRLNKGK